MSDTEQEKNVRLQAVLNALLQHQLSESLGQLEGGFKRWRQGELSAREVHAEVLKHVVRAERLASRVVQGPHDRSALRDAWDAGLIERDEFVSLTGVSPEEVEPSQAISDNIGIPPKPDVIRELLEDGPVLVHVDARNPGVSVPQHFKADPKLVLRFGYWLKPAIPDLAVDDDGLSGTLTFNGAPYHCVLPWPAVYAVVSEVNQKEGMVWPQDVPEIVLSELSAEPRPADTRPRMSTREPVDTPASGKRRASHLKLVD